MTTLRTWPQIARYFTGATALIGNGFSCSMHENFRQSSLVSAVRDAAASLSQLGPEGADALLPDDTADVERVMGDLETAARVLRQLGMDASSLDEIYANLRGSFLKTVRDWHPEPFEVEAQILRRAPLLLEFSEIFTTNYDLLIYWMVMRPTLRTKFTDHFRGSSPTFSPANSVPFPDRRSVVYLHGAIHLEHDDSGTVRKRTAGKSTILGQIDHRPIGWQPLMITGGSPTSKREMIGGVPYLGFGLDRLAEPGNLVVLGHGLGKPDDHVLHAIARRMSRTPGRKALAVSIYREADVSRISSHLQRYGILGRTTFFDACTHPLFGE